MRDQPPPPVTGPDPDEASTYVIDLDGRLRLAPRRSEHVALAGGRDVLAAGEITIVDGRVTEVSNQSTGYCPDPDCWPAVARALDRLGLAHPGGFTTAIVFRSCPDCGERNIVRDGDFICALCDAELPQRWNFDPLAPLSDRQRELLDAWFPGAEVVHDHSWGVAATTVLELAYDNRHLIVKAGGETDHHIARELHAHRNWLRPWTTRNRAPRLLHGDDQAKLLATTYLPGSLALDHEAEPSFYRQAGELLALLHAQTATVDADFERRENEKNLLLLDGPHRIDAATVRRLRDLITGWPTPPVTLVPTHGDWQPRNWLIHDDTVSIIDFGRAAMRPAWTDFNRLTVQDFSTRPDLEEAFLLGYGPDPRAADGSYRSHVREAIGTACWAFAHGQEAFEAQGLRMLAGLR